MKIDVSRGYDSIAQPSGAEPMPSRKLQISVRLLLIAIALIGLNLAGWVATSRYYPFEQIIAFGHGDGRGLWRYYSDGTVTVRRASAPRAAEREVVRIIYPRLVMSRLHAWAPFYGSIALSLLVISILVGDPSQIRLDRRDGLISGSQARCSGGRARTAARWLLVAIGAPLLIVAGLAYRPLPERGADREIRRPLLSFSDIVLDSDGELRRVEAGGSVAYGESEYSLHHFTTRNRTEAGWPSPSPEGFRTHSRPLRTIVQKEDGCVLGYEELPLDRSVVPTSLTSPQWRSPWQLWFPVLFEWDPGPFPSRPIVLQESLRSPLEVWWPIVSSLSVVLLAIVARRRVQRWVEKQ